MTAMAVPTRRVVFIDARVPDRRTLVCGAAPDARIFVLDTDRDGLRQIVDLLARHALDRLDAVHIVSHGEPGRVQLGAAWLDAAGIGARADALARIGAAIRPGGDLLLYGCSVASGAAGEHFIEALSASLGGVDVAAATAPVGDGVWTLDAQTGPVAAGLPFAAEALHAYRGLLGFLTNEQRVNQNSLGAAQAEGSVALLSNGNYIVTWIDNRRVDTTLDADSYGRLLDANGNPIGNEFLIASDTTPFFSNFANGTLNPGYDGFDYSYYAGATTAFPQGGFLSLLSRYHAETDSFDIVGRFFNNDGTTNGNEFVINSPASTGPGQYQEDPSVTVFDDGSFVVAWYNRADTDDASGEITAQRYNAAHQAVGSNFQINTGTQYRQTGVDITALTDGSGHTTGKFVAVWGSETAVHDDSDVYARIFNADGTQAVAEFRVNTTTDRGQYGAHVASLANGGFVVTYTSKAATGTDNEIFFKTYNASGQQVIGETLVDDNTTMSQGVGQVQALPDGGFFISWDEHDGNGNYDVRAQRYDANGNQVGSEFTVPQTATGAQHQTAGATAKDPVAIHYVAGQTNQQAVVTWDGAGTGDSNGIFTRTIEFHNAPSGADNSKTIVASASYTFAQSDFGFSDSNFDKTTAKASGDALSGVKITTLPANGTLYIDPDGAGTGSLGTAVTQGQTVSAADIAAGKLVYVPGSSGNGAFTFQVVDNGGTEAGSADTDATANNFTVNVTRPNIAPVVDLNGGAAGISTTLAYTENQAATAIAPNGTVTDADSTDFNGGSLQVEFTANGTSADQLTIQNQGTGAGQIGVSGSNVTYGGTVIGTFTGGTNGNPLTITFASAAATPAAVQALEQHILYSNNSENPSTATRTVNFTVKDGDGIANGGQDTGSATATITVTATNDAPSTPTDTDGANNTVLEGADAGTAVGITASATDPEGSTVTYSLIDDANGAFKIDRNTGVVTVADPSKIDYESSGNSHSYTIAVQASDGSLGTFQTFTVAVGNVAPSTPTDGDTAQANSVTEGTAQGTYTGLTASATDVSGGAVIYTLTNDAGGRFTIDANGRVLVSALGASQIDYETSGGSYTITVLAKDSSGATSTTQDFTINVTDVAPSTPTDADGTANSAAEGAATGTTVGITGSSSDVNGGTITYSLTDPTNGGFTINSSTGVVSVADGSKIDFETSGGSYNLTVRASDGTLTSSQVFAVTVTDVNEPPVASNDANTVTQRNSVNGNVIVDAPVTDPDGTTPTISTIAFGATSGPVSTNTPIGGDHGTLTISSNGDYTYKADVEGGVAVGATVTDTFHYTATDGTNSDDADLTISVTGSGTGDAGDNVFLLTGSGHSATGLAGNDTYLVDGLDDQVVEATNGGTDTVKATIDYTLGDNVERLVLAGRGNIDGTGNAAVNIVKGNVGDNYLDGGDGRDMLIGYGGNDTFVFSVAPGTNNVDRITDFNLNDATHADKIALDTSVFTGLSFGNDGSLVGSQFASVVAGQKYGADVHIVYRSDKGALYYDADGYGGAGAVLFASLDGRPNVGAQDIVKFDMLHA